MTKKELIMAVLARDGRRRTYRAVHRTIFVCRDCKGPLAVGASDTWCEPCKVVRREGV